MLFTLLLWKYFPIIKYCVDGVLNSQTMSCTWAAKYAIIKWRLMHSYVMHMGRKECNNQMKENWKYEMKEFLILERMCKTTNVFTQFFGVGKRGQKSCREAWYVRTFQAVEAVEGVSDRPVLWYMHIPNTIYRGICKGSGVRCSTRRNSVTNYLCHL